MTRSAEAGGGGAQHTGPNVRARSGRRPATSMHTVTTQGSPLRRPAGAEFRAVFSFICSFPFLLAFDVGGLGFEYGVLGFRL